MEDAAPLSEPIAARLRNLSRGSQLMLAGALLLVVDLFLTWQSIEVAFPGAGTATLLLDGWDVWGLVIAFVAIGLVVLVSVVYASEVETSDDLPWERWVLLAAVILFGATFAKSVTDAYSAWASYVGLVLAGAVLAGALLNWSAMRAAKRRSTAS